jgi:RimJ/RimL family protein N-acetyltransferase
LAGTEIVGYIGYAIKRAENYVHGLHIVHFGGKDAKGGFIFGRDVMTALRDIFDKFGFTKIVFTVAIGNPAEKIYDRLAKRYGGRIVGIYRKETRLIDSKFYDVKAYEILAEEYFSSKKL